MEGRKKILGKIILLGEAQTGKTNFLNKTVHGRFNENYRPTIGADFSSKEYEIGEKIVTLQYWDTAGQERFQSLGVAFYRGADAYFLFFDITNRSSFERVRAWKDEFLLNVGKDAFGILVGNKIDRNDERVVTYEEGKDWADREKMMYLEISVKTGQGCENLERIMASKISTIEQAAIINRVYL